MNKEKYNQIIDEAYKNYINSLFYHWSGNVMGYVVHEHLSKEEFITKCKTDVEFSERCGLRIEVRELSQLERVKMFEQKTNTDTSFFPVLTETLTFHKIPTKLITLTYKNEKIEVYE